MRASTIGALKRARLARQSPRRWARSRLSCIFNGNFAWSGNIALSTVEFDRQGHFNHLQPNEMVPAGLAIPLHATCFHFAWFRAPFRQGFDFGIRELAGAPAATRLESDIDEWIAARIGQSCEGAST